MDQDSVVDGSLIRAYQAAVDAQPERKCLAPAINGNGRSSKTEISCIEYAITSGNLVRVNLFDEIGLYDEGLFIDCVDFDFSLRLRRAGHAIYRVPNASMEHHLGEDADVPGFLEKFYDRHSPVRRYYQTRNYLYLAERYLLQFPGFIIKLGLLQILLTVLIGFLDPSPVRSYRAVIRGIKDYVARKDGPYMEPA
jgi:rhamnosyltransferase